MKKFLFKNTDTKVSLLILLWVLDKLIMLTMFLWFNK